MISTLIALPTSQTMTNAMMPIVTIKELYSHDRSAAANPSELSVAVLVAVSPKTVTTNGTKAPAATSPLILFSTASAISNGFLSAVGAAVPKMSFAATRATSSRAGIQNVGCANHGRLARFPAGVR